MSLKIYNTLSRKKEKFVPLNEGEVKMYACGVTVYDRCHVGHARALFTFDVVLRYLRFLGYKTIFVRNFTDLDDKIIQRARAEGSEPEVNILTDDGSGTWVLQKTATATRFIGQDLDAPVTVTRLQLLFSHPVHDLQEITVY